MTHSSSQRGIAIAAIVIIVAIVIIGAGAVYYTMPQKTPATLDGEKMMEEKEAMIQKGLSPIPADSAATMKKEEGDIMEKDNKDAMVKYAGSVLAGNSAPLLDFTKADFDAAVKSDKLVVLYFYANWCPICREEFPKAEAAFNELTTDQVIGFRVNFNDNQTDSDEQALARTQGVAYQHTKVFVKNNQQVLKSPESWEQSRYVTEIKNALAQ